MFTRYGWHSDVVEAPIVKRMLQGIKLKVFSLSQIYHEAHFGTFYILSILGFISLFLWITCNVLM